MSPADSAARAGAMPEASGDSSSETLAEDMSTTLFHCNLCGGDRHHSQLAEHFHDWRDEVGGDDDYPPMIVTGKEVYVLLRCCGCDTVSLQHKSYFSENDRPSIKVYPPRQFRKPPIWFQELDGILVTETIAFIPRLLKEIYGSMYSQHRAVSAMGIRALIELIMIDKIKDQGSFRKNVDAFQTGGFISAFQRSMLEPTLEFGHASMHRNHAPKMQELIAALDITENLIHTLYVLPDKAAQLEKTVPKRTKQ